MKLVGTLALFAVFGAATSASAIIISGGPSTSPPGGGSCSLAAGTAPDLSGGVTVSCTGLNPSAVRRLYYGVNNAPSAGNGPNGDTMNNASPGGAEIFRYSTNTATSITYGGTTSIFNVLNGATSGVNELNVLSFQSGTGSLICDGRTAALDSAANGDVRCLWQVTNGSFTTTVNVLGAFAPNTPTTNAAPTVFDPTPTMNGKQERDHVNLAFYWDSCGNGTREGDEQCDDGASNGAASDCCDANCNFVASGTVCRPAAGPCDVQETCTGTSETCPLNVFLSTTTVCRAAAGVCDVAEHCTGASPLCPADAFASSTTVCRSANGACDAAETCPGTSAACPADGLLPSTAVCRSANGACDVAESCTGTSRACPADALAPSTTVCRSAAGSCDVAESCTGTSTACPADAVAPSGTVCRSANGACDVAETCDGSAAACPADGFEPATTVCRSSAGDCDVAESCTGTSAACPPDSVAGAFVTCRPSTAPCDAPENCTGSSVTCPPDALEPATFTCRAAAGVCDVAENCTGSSANCPADQKSTAVCRSRAGSCDVPETCDGSSNSCPADAFAPVGTTCRAAAGTCDVAEVCSGLSATCPNDVAAPNGTPCNDGNSCTSPDSCQGGVCIGTPDPTTCADHYLCYKAKAPTFATSPTVTLVDDFDGTVSATSLRARQLCTPASKNGSPVTDDTTHLEAYAFSQSPAHTRRTVSATDQFGTLSLTTIKPDTLLVPTNKDLTTTPPAPDDNSINVNHYKCYKVKVTAGTPKFPQGIQATVGDQFNAPPKLFNVLKPKHLCNPVQKNGEPVHNPDAHLVCYQVKGAKGQPKHVRRNVFVDNQFGSSTMSTIKESELCVPSVTAP